MKVITDYVKQPRKYANSVGECVVELEDGETIQDVIDRYITTKREWWERQYSDAVEITTYKKKLWDTEKNGFYEKEFNCRMVRMTTKQVYLD